MKSCALFLTLFFAFTASAEALSFQTVIIRGPTRSGFVIEGKVDCYRAYSELFEISGTNELWGKREDVYSFPVGMTCRQDEDFTYVLAYAKFVPVTEKGVRMIEDVIRTHSGADFYGTPIVFETPSEMIIETKVVVSREGKSPVEVRKTELVENEGEFRIGEDFSQRVKAASTDPRSFETLLVEEFGGSPDELRTALKDAGSIQAKKSMIYVFDDPRVSRVLDWWWQSWGATRTCEKRECPYSAP
ncbi:MAG TPA: hypothetical protein PL182_07790 [Pseudobdellovibrionaceae bacterium]|nr:hypothetical protein [Pseudobdellovibrionaceae bacterium]